MLSSHAEQGEVTLRSYRLREERALGRNVIATPPSLLGQVIEKPWLSGFQPPLLLEPPGSLKHWCPALLFK